MASVIVGDQDCKIIVTECPNSFCILMNVFFVWNGSFYNLEVNVMQLMLYGRGFPPFL